MGYWSFKALDIMFQMNLNFHLTLIHWKGLSGLYAHIQKGETKIWNKVSSLTSTWFSLFVKSTAMECLHVKYYKKNSN